MVGQDESHLGEIRVFITRSFGPELNFTAFCDKMSVPVDYCSQSS